MAFDPLDQLGKLLSLAQASQGMKMSRQEQELAAKQRIDQDAMRRLVAQQFQQGDIQQGIPQAQQALLRSGLPGSVQQAKLLSGFLGEQQAQPYKRGQLVNYVEGGVRKQGYFLGTDPNTGQPLFGNPQEAPEATPTTTVNVGLGGKKLAEEMSKDLVSRRQDVASIADSLVGLSQARNLLEEGAITGFGANALLQAGKLLKRVGFNRFDDDIANTEAYIAQMGNQVAEIIKKFGAGTGLSDADREYAQAIVGGKITMDEKALFKIMELNQRASTNIINRYNKDAGQAMKRMGDSLPYDLSVEVDEGLLWSKKKGVPKQNQQEQAQQVNIDALIDEAFNKFGPDASVEEIEQYVMSKGGQ